jgi:hypothetical protein
MNVNEHERLSNITLGHKLNLRNGSFIAVYISGPFVLRPTSLVECF